MSGKKKMKLSKPNVEENKGSEECLDSEKQAVEPVTRSSSCETEKFSLYDLPNEVVLYIYSFLSPVDLAAITELGNRRLRDLTFCVKEANFSSCRKAGAERMLAFFSRSRVKCVKELNFNYTLYIKPQVLVQLICRCKALTVLSVVECGIKYHHLIHIFQNCFHLEELAWNVEELMQLVTTEANNMKTVYLFSDINEASLRSVFFILQNFPNIKNAWINLSSDSITVLPFIGLWLTTSCIEYPALKRRFVLLTNSFQCISLDRDIEFLQSIIEPSELVNPRHTDKSSSENTIYGRAFMSPPYLQLSCEEKAISNLLSEFPRAFSTVSIMLTSEILNVSENLVKSINRAAGIKLKHLSLINEAVTSPRSEHPEPISNEESLAICDTLETLFLTCQFITVLNLVTVHFTAGSPFKAISKLKYLRTLVIPSCAFFKDYKKVHKGDVESKNLEFKDVISKCLLVEDFSLFCCADYHSRVTDSDLFPLKDWEELKHLTVYSVGFRTCSFLRKVADSCKKLQSFSLVSVAPSRVCLFTPDVIYLLKNAKNLALIRINDEKFNPMYERFWNTVGEAVNLEGICIVTQSTVAIQRQVIVNAVKMLKHLHLFHFSASRTPDRLYTEIKKSMQNHGVVNYRMERDCYTKTFNSASRLQYYHQQPHFYCQHIHLSNF